MENKKLQTRLSLDSVLFTKEDSEFCMNLMYDSVKNELESQNRKIADNSRISVVVEVETVEK